MLPCPTGSQIAPGAPSEPDTLLAGVEEAGPFISRDGGATWSEITAVSGHPTRAKWFPGGGGLCLHTILVDPRNAKRWWIGISAVGVLRTEDGGESFAICNRGLPGVPTGPPDTGTTTGRAWPPSPPSTSRSGPATSWR